MRAAILRTTILSSAMAATLVVPVPSALAATRTWNNAGATNWFTAGNWNAAAVPVAADTAVINLGATGPTINAAGAVATTVEVGTTAAGGTLNFSAGGVLTDTTGYLGLNAGSAGAATVTGTGSSWTNTGNLNVGNSGTGTLNIQSGGSVSSTSDTRIGYNAGSTGTATVDGSGSSLSATNAEIYVGFSGNGTLNIQNSGSVSDKIGAIGNNVGSASTVTVTGTRSSWTNSGNLNVGNSGSGTLNIQSGGSVSDVTGSIGTNASSTGTATVAGIGSAWTASNGVFVGFNGTGALNLQSGAHINSSRGDIGTFAGAVGTATVDGTGSIWSNSGNINVGDSGTGTLKIQNGGSVSSTAGTFMGTSSGSNGMLIIQSGGVLSDVSSQIGTNTGSTGTAIVTDTGSSWTNSSNLNVGSSGTGTLNIQSGGSVSSAASTFVGTNNGSTGVLIIQSGGVLSDVSSQIGTSIGSTGAATVTGTGSSWTNSGNLNVGNSGTGTLTVSNSSSVSSAGLVVGQSGTGTLTVSNGSTVTTSSYFTVGRNTGSSGIATIQSGAAVHAGDAEIGFAGGNGTVVITGIGSLLSIDGTYSNGNAILGCNCDPVLYPGNGTATVTLANGGTMAVAGSFTLGSTTGSVGTLNIGAASGSPAAAPGTVSANTVAFGSGTGTLNFNHTSSNYVFAPAITGSGTINALAGTTVLTGDLTSFSGSTNLLGGNVDYAFGGGSTLSTALTGSGGLSIASGGITYLTSNSSAFSGTTTVTDGSTLSVNGQLGGRVEVADGGTLKGHGTAGVVMADAGSILAPGNSIGTLTVSSLTTAPGTVYQAELDANGGHDLIHATGTATLNGGQVAASYAAGSYLPGMSYTILTADGGVSGHFDNEADTLGTLFMDAQLFYDPNNVTLKLVQFRNFNAVAQTPTQFGVANAAQSLATGNAVYDHIVVLTDPVLARTAFNQLSGEAYASTQSALLDEQHLISDLLLDRLDSIATRTDATRPRQLAYQGDDLRGMLGTGTRSGFWVQGFGDWNQLQGDGNSASMRDSSSGVLLGADGDLGEAWQGGAAVGYSDSAMDDVARSASGQSKNYHAAIYAGTRPSASMPTLRLGSSLTWHDLDSHRSVDFNGFSDTDKASYGAYTAQAFADLSHAYSITPASNLAPFGTIGYLHQSIDSFTESGGSSALHVDGADTDLLSTTLGIRGNHAIRINDADLPTIHHADLSGSIGWKHLTGDVTPTTTARFASGSDGFTADGAPLAHNAFTYNAALTLDLDSNASLGLRYAGQLATEAQDQSLTGQFKYAF